MTQEIMRKIKGEAMSHFEADGGHRIKPLRYDGMNDLRLDLNVHIRNAEARADKEAKDRLVWINGKVQA